MLPGGGTRTDFGRTISTEIENRKQMARAANIKPE
jgi:hypothetical protein